MKSRFLLIVVLACTYGFSFSFVRAQDYSVVGQIKAITAFEDAEILSVAPHFPLKEKDDEATKLALQKWHDSYPKEFDAFVNHPKYQENSFAWYPFGINAQRESIDMYLNDDILEWLDMHHISEAELKVASPNFPRIPNSGDRRQDAVVFNQLKIEWLANHYEEFLQMMRLVYPHYGEEPMEGPYFMSYRPRTEKPMLSIEDSNDPDKKLKYDMMLQHWYYMHDQNKYRELYGEPPVLPEGYNSMEEYIKDNTKNNN